MRREKPVQVQFMPRQMLASQHVPWSAWSMQSANPLASFAHETAAAEEAQFVQHPTMTHLISRNSALEQHAYPGCSSSTPIVYADIPALTSLEMRVAALESSQTPIEPPTYMAQSASQTDVGVESDRPLPSSRVWSIPRHQEKQTLQEQVDALQRSLDDERANRESAIAAACEAAWKLHAEQEQRIIQLEADLDERNAILSRIRAFVPDATMEEEWRSAAVVQEETRRRQGTRRAHLAFDSHPTVE